MKRQKRYINQFGNESLTDSTSVPMQRISQPKFDNTLEAQVQNGDTLQALALRFHCAVADIKRLNKIDKDNEIFARKVIKVPVTPHSILLETLPAVHKSGQSSPKHSNSNANNITPNVLEDDVLKEKLLVAAVSSSNGQLAPQKLETAESINNIILNSKKLNNYYVDDQNQGSPDRHANDISEPLLECILDESIPQPRVIPGPSKSSLDFSGSDCDISWIFLFIFILALCFAIPLIYVFYVAEHPEKFHHNPT